MPADAIAVDEALSRVLVTDATLRAKLPDGVYYDAAPPGKTRFVILSLLAHEDAYQFQGAAFERFVYLVKAVALESTGADVKGAAQRIHTLLQDAALTMTGYTRMVIQRTERVRFLEVDEDTDARWQHLGGQYEVYASPS